jgi:glycosyltransferase involved in cell wall biosynthesis
VKILVLHQYFLEEDDPGGSRFNELSSFWLNEGHEVHVIAGNLQYNSSFKKPEYVNRFFKVKYQKGVRVIRCFVYEGYNKSFVGRLFGYISFLLSSLIASVFYTDRKYDVVLFTSPPIFLGLSGYFISLLKGSKFVTEIRDLWPESAIDTGVLSNRFLINLMYKLEAFLYAKSDKICVLTPAFREKLIHNKGVNPKKIFYIPNAADFSIYNNSDLSFENLNLIREELSIDGFFSIVYVGAHGVANDLIQILEAARLLLNHKIKFILIGDGMQKSFLKNKASEFKLNNVIFIDPIPKNKVFEYISAADAGISILKDVPTFKTIYSNKTFDYMTCSKPVIVCIDGISKDLIVDDAKCGIFSPPGNPYELAARLVDYANRKSLYQKHGINGNEYVKSKFDRLKLSHQYLQELKSIN